MVYYLLTVHQNNNKTRPTQAVCSVEQLQNRRAPYLLNISIVEKDCAPVCNTLYCRLATRGTMFHFPVPSVMGTVRAGQQGPVVFPLAITQRREETE